MEDRVQVRGIVGVLFHLVPDNMQSTKSKDKEYHIDKGLNVYEDPFACPWGQEATGVSISPAVELLELNVLAPSPAAENLPDLPTLKPSVLRRRHQQHPLQYQSRGHPPARILSD